MRRSLGILVIGVAIASGCSSVAPAESAAGPSATPGPSSPAGEAAACEPIDLRTPSGERVDLTGTWRSPVGTHHVRQHNSCVWWVMISEVRESPQGHRDRLMVLFRGDLASDFTLSGETMLTMGSGPPIHDTVTFSVEFSPDGETMTLTTSDPDVLWTPMEYVGPLDPDAL